MDVNRSEVFVKLGETCLWPHRVLHWQPFGGIGTLFGTAGTIRRQLAGRFHSRLLLKTRFHSAGTRGGPDCVPTEPYGRVDIRCQPQRLSDFLDLGRVICLVAVSGYSRNVVGNLHSAGVAVGLADIDQNSNWVRVETFGHNFVERGLLFHRSSKWVAPLVYAVLVVLHDGFDYA